MDNQTQKAELVDIMETMDECLDEIKMALDKLDFVTVVKLMTVLTEAFIAVNEFIDSDLTKEVDSFKENINENRVDVNEALEEVLRTYDNHDMELRLDGFEKLKNTMLLWTGNIYNALDLHQ